MLKEAMDRLIGLAPANQLVFGARSYTDKPLHPVKEPLAPPIEVKTLTGLVDMVANGVDGLIATNCVIHVSDCHTVLCVGKNVNHWGERRQYVKAELVKIYQPFGQWKSTEEFVIWLQSGFVPGAGDLDALLQVAGNLTADAVLISEDDGIRQRVTIKKGVSLKESVMLKRRVSLAPYRTFLEVDQPVSEFVFRVKSSEEGEPPVCALFEADGGRWRLEAMLRMKTWLEGLRLDSVVVA